MNREIFKNISNYIEIYDCLSKGSLKKVDLVKSLIEVGFAESTAKKHVKLVFSQRLPCIEVVEDEATLNLDGLKKELNAQVASLERNKTGKRTKQKQDGNVAPVKKGHSPEYNKLNREKNDLEKEVQSLKEELKNLKGEMSRKLAMYILKEMNKAVLIPSTASSCPPEVLRRDFFFDNPGSQLDKFKLTCKGGGELESIYKVTDEPGKDFTEDNYFKRLFSHFQSGRLFEKRIEDQDGVVRERGIRCDLDENRLKTINLLLADKTMDNQVKLSTYAWWYFSNDPEMAELLQFAADHAINADLVITLLEKPEKFKNYRTMRGFLRQACNASEAHIKSETIKELLCGDWQVVAEYGGKMTHFKLVPVEELSHFQQLLREFKFVGADATITEALSATYMKKETKEEKSDERDIEVPEFLHENKEERNNVDASYEDAALDDFADEAKA